MHLYNVFEMRTLELAERSVEGAEVGVATGRRQEGSLCRNSEIFDFAGGYRKLHH